MTGARQSRTKIKRPVMVTSSVGTADPKLLGKGFQGESWIGGARC